MKKRIAALDLGTNTFHLIIADVYENKIEQIVYHGQTHVKLGEGGITNGVIAAPAIERGIRALSKFESIINAHKVDLIRAVGTAALRSAINGTEFILKAKETTGIEIEIIDGEREAGLIYHGVKQAVDLTQNSLIMDIGGGSVEFIFANTSNIQWKKSYPIGAAKLMAMFHHTDPISGEDIETINHHLDLVLAVLKRESEKFRPKMLIGSAGAFETFAALCEIKSGNKQAEIFKRYLFDNPTLNNVISDIIKSSHHERVNNEAILSVRTDMIVVAAILTRYVIQQLHIPSVLMTTYALKEGLLVSIE